MSSIHKTSIFSTERFLAIEIFQNHIDEFHSLFEQFCLENKNYRWYILINSKAISGMVNIEKSLDKNTPSRLTYVVADTTLSRELTVQIDNGVTINIKNGSHALYGLFKQVIDMAPNMNAPHFLVFLRRYWLFNLLGSILLIPSLIIVLSGGGWNFLWWLVPVGMLEFAVSAGVFTDITQDDWEDIILSTKIRYKTYSSKTGSSIYALFGSSKTIVSIAASLATIITFFIYIATKK